VDLLNYLSQFFFIIFFGEKQVRLEREESDEPDSVSSEGSKSFLISTAGIFMHFPSTSLVRRRFKTNLVSFKASSPNICFNLSSSLVKKCATKLGHDFPNTAFNW